MVPASELLVAFGTAPLQSRVPSVPARFFGIGLGLTVAVVLSGVIAVVVAAVAPRLTDQSLRTVREDGGLAFLVGLGVLVVGGIALFLLAITGLGLILAVPGIIALAVVGFAGSAIGTLLVGRFVLGVVSSSAGESDTLLVAFVGAVALVAVSLVPILGGLVSFVVSTTGFGAVVLVLWDRYR